MQPKVMDLHELFDDWYTKQKLFEDYTISAQEKRIPEYDEKRYRNLYNQLGSYPANLKQLKSFTYGTKNGLDQERLIKLRTSLTNLEQFFSILQKDNFTSKIINNEEQKISLDKLIAKYNNFGRLLHPSKNPKEQNKFLYELANNFFFFAFNQQTFPLFKEFILKEACHPLARFIYSIIWINLASKGWSSWHDECIKNLQKQSKNKEVVYCAGGTDIFHLLYHNIYNLRIIDPFLPTQKKFYCDRWRYFLHGSQDDQIICTFDNHKLKLKRKKILRNGTFSLCDKKLTAFLTTWEIFKNNETEPCGTLIFERRALKQTDFDTSSTKRLLISINELYFITKSNNNWGIKLKNLPKDFQLFVKQLKNPLDKQTLLNMRKADRIETIEFIQLGSNID